MVTPAEISVGMLLKRRPKTYVVRSVGKKREGRYEITETQVKSIVKKIGRSGFGVGHIKQSKMYQDY